MATQLYNTAVHQNKAKSSYFTEKTSLVFIDSHVDNFQMLAESITPDIEQISAILATRKNIAALHVVSHGSEGSLFLGNSILNARALESNSAKIQQWQAALAPNADILLYGCNVAAGDEGKAFISALSQLTGANIAASTIPTGNRALGGDWKLEIHTGKINAVCPFPDDVQAAYPGILPASRVADIFSGTSSSNASDLAVFNNKLYFRANGNDGAGIELWAYDGTNPPARVADINTFTPATDANGTAYSSFQFTVNDGTDDSASAYTLTFNVTAVNDAPSFTATNPAAISQNAGAQAIANWATFAAGGGAKAII